jgi:hypothetical protein
MKAGKSAAEGIFTGDDYDPNQSPDPAPAPPYEPRLTPNTPQVRNAPASGAQGARGGGLSRGSSGGGGGRMIKNRRMMSPMEMTQPDYDLKLMQKGGSVRGKGPTDAERLAPHEVDMRKIDPEVREKLRDYREKRGDYPWDVKETDPKFRHVGPAAAAEEGLTQVLPEEPSLPPSKQPSVTRGATMSFAKGGGVNYGKDYRKGK